MSTVRVLVGTRKGAFVLTSDGKRGAIGAAFHSQGGHTPLGSQGPEHGAMAAPLDRLRGLCPVATGSAGVEPGQCLRAAAYIEKEAGFRGESLTAG
jgi:hypothetical protein